MADDFSYESNAEEVKKAIRSLEKQALRKTAKFLRKIIKKTVPVDEGILRKNVGSWVKGKASEDPVLQIGVYSRERAKRKGYVYAYHAHLVQFGTKNMQGTDYLRAPVYGNIGNIRNMQAEFLSQIEQIKERGLPMEEDEEADD